MKPKSVAMHAYLRLPALVFLLAGFGLRLYRLGVESLWYDETVSAVLARKSIPALIAHTAGDIHPPGYYLLLHGWAWLTQPTAARGLEYLLAWPSAGFGLLIMALLFALGRRLFSPSVALIALAVAAVHPFQLWYSQEVRMYTLGAALGLLGLWALLQVAAGRSTRRWLVIYSLTMAAGLYTLYYFLFLLGAINLCAVWLYGCQTKWERGQRRQLVLPWLLAQLGVLILWLPWLPIFWRQLVEPPVPVWRTPWQGWNDIVPNVWEGMAALFMGQSLPQGPIWSWALASVLVCLLALRIQRSRRGNEAIPLLLLYLFAPLSLIYVVSAMLTPLYHVRYLFIFAAPFLLLIAVVIDWLSRGRRRFTVLFVLLVLLLASWNLQRFWNDPRFRSDDHRAAVDYLAEQWRPGDAILVNAGWAYTAIKTYWPEELTGPFAALPPAAGDPVRLIDLPSTPVAGPLVVRTGSVDGPRTLGWGDPASDFFAMSSAQTIATLEQLRRSHARLWHYRIYDTVSDPTGVIRQWLDKNGEKVLDLPFAGRDFLRLQLYSLHKATPPSVAVAPVALATFGDALRLDGFTYEPVAPAGTRHYFQSVWRPLPGLGSLPNNIAFSLRLYAADGALLTQEDAAPITPTSAWSPTQTMTVPLAISIPIAAIPQVYQVVLVAYNLTNGGALPVVGAGEETPGFSGGELQVLAGRQLPLLNSELASFDYIDLLAVQPFAQTVAPRDPLRLNLVWRPRASAYRDTYNARLALVASDGAVLTTWEEPLGGWAYPSGEWPPQWPVLDQKQLPMADAPVGVYTLTLAVVRQRDELPIAAQRGLLSSASAPLVIGRVAVSQ